VGLVSRSMVDGQQVKKRKGRRVPPSSPATLYKQEDVPLAFQRRACFVQPAPEQKVASLEGCRASMQFQECQFSGQNFPGYAEECNRAMQTTMAMGRHCIAPCYHSPVPDVGFQRIEESCQHHPCVSRDGLYARMVPQAQVPLALANQALPPQAFAPQASLAVAPQALPLEAVAPQDEPQLVTEDPPSDSSEGTPSCASPQQQQYSPKQLEALFAEADRTLRTSGAFPQGYQCAPGQEHLCASSEPQLLTQNPDLRCGDPSAPWSFPSEHNAAACYDNSMMQSMMQPVIQMVPMVPGMPPVAPYGPYGPYGHYGSYGGSQMVSPINGAVPPAQVSTSPWAGYPQAPRDATPSALPIESAPTGQSAQPSVKDFMELSEKVSGLVQKMEEAEATRKNSMIRTKAGVLYMGGDSETPQAEARERHLRTELRRTALELTSEAERARKAQALADTRLQVLSYTRRKAAARMEKLRKENERLQAEQAAAPSKRRKLSTHGSPQHRPQQQLPQRSCIEIRSVSSDDQGEPASEGARGSLSDAEDGSQRSSKSRSVPPPPPPPEIVQEPLRSRRTVARPSRSTCRPPTAQDSSKVLPQTSTACSGSTFSPTKPTPSHIPPPPPDPRTSSVAENIAVGSSPETHHADTNDAPRIALVSPRVQRITATLAELERRMALATNPLEDGKKSMQVPDTDLLKAKLLDELHDLRRLNHNGVS